MQILLHVDTSAGLFTVHGLIYAGTLQYHHLHLQAAIGMIILRSHPGCQGQVRRIYRSKVQGPVAERMGDRRLEFEFKFELFVP